MIPPRPMKLPRSLMREINRLASQRSRAEVTAAFRRQQAHLLATALDMLLAGHQPGDVARELAAADCPAE